MARKKGLPRQALAFCAVIAFSATAVPWYLAEAGANKEEMLREQLASLRGAIDQYYGETHAYPASLDTLVAAHYLRLVPRDPITGRSDSWQVTTATLDGNTGIYDVHSGAEGEARDGTAYANW